MFLIQKCTALFQTLCQPGIRAPALVIALIALSVLSFQGSILEHGNSSSSLFLVFGKGSLSRDSLSVSEGLGEVIAPNDARQYAPPDTEGTQSKLPPVADAEGQDQNVMDETDEDPADPGIDREESLEEDELSIDLENGVRIKKVHGGYFTLEKPSDAGSNSSVGTDEEPGTSFKPASSNNGRTNSSLDWESWDKQRNLDSGSSLAPSFVSHPVSSDTDKATQVKQGNSPSVPAVSARVNISSSEERKIEKHGTVAWTVKKRPLQSGVSLPNCVPAKDRAVKKGKKKAAVTTMSEMYQTLLKNRGSSCSMAPRWPSPSDRQILEAKRQIVNAPTVENDAELYSPIFRNISVFKRSYDMMEKMLKVYIYKDGEQPIFHRPPLTGIYASEGWFMKHMEANRRFVVSDPRKAHLFYMPFSSSRLRFDLYDPASPGRRNLVEYLKNYVNTIAGKYPFWNRTDGADHFLAACHDWAPDETAKAMGNSIRALCNADVTEGFELGKDVSLPETNVRNEGRPLWDLGGKPPQKRPFLAFFAGQMHGYLRPILLQYWENKDSDMKVSGPLPHNGGGRRKRTAPYVQYMKSSRYCICPRGYEVNSPRVVEAIFYGCVPVIISDNFVPPFFEVLNWEAFSVVVAERDVPRLKEILVSIPKKEYTALQTGVKNVRQHFLWNKKPVKYDLFHMILHSVWLNRVFSLHAVVE